MYEPEKWREYIVEEVNRQVAFQPAQVKTKQQKQVLKNFYVHKIATLIPLTIFINTLLYFGLKQELKRRLDNHKR